MGDIPRRYAKATPGALDLSCGAPLPLVEIKIVDSHGDEVLGHCRKLIAGYKVPKQVHFVDSLPMTDSGKIRKRTLGQRFQGAGE